MSKALIYAELLSNIRQISVIASLDTPCDASTKVELSANSQEVIVHHQGRTTSLILSGQLASSSRPQKPVLGSKELSWRLPLSDSFARSSAESATNNEAPWPAMEMAQDAENYEFYCRSCEEVVLKEGILGDWRDLPSENWAEMMDFWHCHKPDVPEANGNGHAGHSHEDPNASRGYGANAKFTAQSGIGFVDLTTFLVAESDCSGVEVENSAEGDVKYPKLICSSCQSYLGHIDHQAEGYRLYKWRLKSSRKLSQPTLSSLITAQLQAIMLAQCCSRLVLVPMNWRPSSQDPTPSPPLPFLSMWILSPAIRYSTTAQEGPKSTSHPGTPAMKIFWKSIHATEADGLLDASTHEEVSLPVETILEIEKCLRDSAAFLPPNGRRFQDWDVGLLDRFEMRDT